MKSPRKSQCFSGDPEQVRRILILKPSSLGDIFHTFPAVAALARAFPKAEFDWLVHPVFAEALDYAPVPIRRRILFRRKELGRLKSFLPELWKLRQELQQERYDLIFDFQGLLRSAFCGFLAAGPMVGFARPRERSARYFYHAAFRINFRLHAVRRNVKLVERFLGKGPIVPLLPELPEYPERRQTVWEKIRRIGLDPERPLVAIVAGARWESKTFPPALFAEIIRAAAAKAPEMQFVVLGSPADQKTAGTVAGLCGPEVRIGSLAGMTQLGELVEAVRCCKVMLANDSGPIHIASALQIPVVGLFGPTEPLFTGPFGDCHAIMQRTDLKCIKCLKKQCPKRNVFCHRINAEQSAEALLERWKGICR